MTMTILNVAFPLAPVGPDAVGGAEQVLSAIDHALVKEGHQSVVVACEGSYAQGSLVASCRLSARFDEDERQRTHRLHREALQRALREFPVDLIHMHGVDFMSYLPRPGIPVLVTLHLPLQWYPPEVFHLDRPDTHLQCVSRSQLQDCSEGARAFEVIENGVPLDRLSPIGREFGYVITLGRICPEKGFHLAALASRKAKAQLLIGGTVFGYDEHVRYFREELEPLLARGICRYVGAVAFRYKRLLLAGARCLLVPSLIPETSSLVAMEALACGTPVVAFGAGALREIVEHGRTGFIVSDVDEMADAIGAVSKLDRHACRVAAEERFPVDRMTGRYIETYKALL